MFSLPTQIIKLCIVPVRKEESTNDALRDIVCQRHASVRHNKAERTFQSGGIEGKEQLWFISSRALTSKFKETSAGLLSW